MYDYHPMLSHNGMRKIVSMMAQAHPSVTVILQFVPVMRYDWFIDSLFRQMGIDIACPDYTVLVNDWPNLVLKSPSTTSKKLNLMMRCMP